MSRERPILFSAPMVRAILDGRKTQTRRVVKPQPLGLWSRSQAFPLGHTFVGIVNGPGGAEDVPRDHCWTCPYGVIGDRLWVRETWRYNGCMRSSSDNFKGTKQIVTYIADESMREFLFDDGEPQGIPKQPPQREGEMYSLRDAPLDFKYDGSNTYTDRLSRWWRRKIPGIHMPRWASRITLEVTGVRVERLQDITDKDAEAEGVERVIAGEGWRNYDVTPAQAEAGVYPMCSAGDSFHTLWRTINGADSWAANPWVWVVEFRRVQP